MCILLLKWRDRQLHLKFMGLKMSLAQAPTKKEWLLLRDGIPQTVPIWGWRGPAQRWMKGQVVALLEQSDSPSYQRNNSSSKDGGKFKTKKIDRYWW